MKKLRLFLFIFSLVISLKGIGQANQCFITMDGCFEDWYKHENIVRVKEGNDSPFEALSVSNDTKRLYVYVELKDELLLNELNDYYLEIDADNNPLTGYRLGGFGSEMLLIHYVAMAHMAGGVMIVIGFLTRW